jgi:hypothetical protein
MIVINTWFQLVIPMSGIILLDGTGVMPFACGPTFGGPGAALVGGTTEGTGEEAEDVGGFCCGGCCFIWLKLLSH